MGTLLHENLENVSKMCADHNVWPNSTIVQSTSSSLPLIFHSRRSSSPSAIVVLSLKRSQILRHSSCNDSLMENVNRRMPKIDPITSVESIDAHMQSANLCSIVEKKSHEKSCLNSTFSTQFALGNAQTTIHHHSSSFDRNDSIRTDHCAECEGRCRSTESHTYFGRKKANYWILCRLIRRLLHCKLNLLFDQLSHRSSSSTT
ncbi:hypothetical protein AB6A40_001549 [Gnathostoma spinigerum]|uniref:Uncharacterized protein n=1 Tax=Gnathostoma spinigerum TaxID=75299 RepID=A0ABD6E4F3_9BILA